jgi:septal ring factor EnvC (AmiA/AmiB activator)
MPFKKNLRSYAALASLAVLGLAPVLASCGPTKATEEQMKTISDLDQQRESLRTDMQRAQDNLRDAQGKLANADRDLADCQSDTRAASDGLQRWPNVWADSADWRVAPPPAPETMTKKMKKH